MCIFITVRTCLYSFPFLISLVSRRKKKELPQNSNFIQHKEMLYYTSPEDHVLAVKLPF